MIGLQYQTINGHIKGSKEVGPHQVSLGRLLQGKDGRALEAKIGLEVLGDLTDKTLEGKLADEKLRRLLVAADFAQGHRAGPVPAVIHEGRQHQYGQQRVDGKV